MTHADSVIRESEISPTLNARMGTGGNQVPIMTEIIPKAYCIAGNMVDRETTMHGTGVSEEISSTLTAVDRHAVMSTVGGQSTYAIGNGQADQLKMSEKVGALNCMHDQIAVMQEVVTENKLSEACALMTDGDSTDRM